MTRRLIRIILFMCFAIPLAAQVNNSGFETGGISPWLLWQNGGSAEISTDRTEGSYSIRLHSGEAAIYQIGIDVFPSTTYRLNFDAKKIGNDNAWIIVKEFSGSNSSKGYQVISTEYLQGEIFFTTSGGTNEIRIDVWKGQGNGQLFVDNFSLEIQQENMKIISAPISSGEVGLSYSYTLQTSGENGLKSYSIIIPDWLSWDKNTATLFGTPSAQDEGNHRIRINVRDTVIDLKHEFIIHVNGANTVKIMPLGNSITDGDDLHSSYRRELSNLLKDNNYEVDFVGSKFWNGFLDNSPPDGEIFDMNHEGHEGWDSQDILTGATFDPGRGNLSSWLTNYTPDIVLLHVGTNDVFNCRSNTDVLSNMDQIISTLRSNNPQVVILLAQILPLGNSEQLGIDDTYCGGLTLSQRVQSLNTAFTSYVPLRNTSISPVILVDQNSGFNPSNDLYDGIHPNINAEGQMAQIWYNAIVDVLGVPPTITSAIPSETIFLLPEQIYNYTITAVDSDLGSNISFSSPNLPTWLNFDSNTGTLSGTPTVQDAGQYKVVLRASDSLLKADMAFYIRVLENRTSRSFYVSPSGNDLNPGTQSLPWKTAGANIFKIQAGDELLFQGGEVFSESLFFDENFNGSASDPIKISSYGTGRALIAPPSGSAIIVRNNAGFEIKNINIIGNRDYNDLGGIVFQLTEDFTGEKDYVLLDGVDVSNFHNEGIFFGGFGVGRIKNITVKNVMSHDNVMGGMTTYSAFAPDYNFENVLVEDCRFYQNFGDPIKMDNHSGNGIIVGSSENVLIQRCIAHDNGGLNVNPQGGPVGIWTFESKDVIFQYNESYNNKTGNTKDGGGFDIDGGVINGTMQYNYSHDNDGAGYLIAQFNGATPLLNAVIRYNVSENDGRNNNFGGIHLFSSGSSGGVVNADIYNNTIYVNSSSIGIPKGVEVESGFFENINFYNNIFYSEGNTELMKIVTEAVHDVEFKSNLYYSSSNYKFHWGNSLYTDFNSWQNATDQEKLNGSNVGIISNPLLNAAGGGITLDDPYLLETFTGYNLSSGSPAIDEGIDLSAEFGLSVGVNDFAGTSIPDNASYDLGAVEYISPQPPGIPDLVSVIEDFTQVNFSWAPVVNADGYIIEYGTSTGVYPNSNNVFTDTSFVVNGLSDGVTIYMVVKAYNSYGDSGFSNEFSGTTLIPATGYNLSFEQGDLTGWIINESQTSSFIQNTNATDGNYNALLWDSVNYQSFIYQDIVGIPNGTYSLTLDAASSAGFNQLQLEASDFGSTTLVSNINQGSWYNQASISNILVTNNQIRIGLRAIGTAYSWAVLDNFQLESNCTNCRNETVIPNYAPQKDAILPDEVSIFPMPASERLNLNYFSMEKKDIEYHILDLQGRLIGNSQLNLEIGLNSFKIDVGNLKPGSYIIRINDKNSHSYHIIIQ